MWLCHVPPAPEASAEEDRRRYLLDAANSQSSIRLIRLIRCFLFSPFLAVSQLPLLGEDWGEAVEKPQLFSRTAE